MPQIFSRATAPPVANFSFVDFATGKGVVEFFLGATSNQNRMSNTAFYGNQIYHKGSSVDSGTFTKSVDVDFDLEFLKTLIVEGEAIVTVPGMLRAAGGGGSPGFQFYPVVKIRHWDGTTETDLVEQTGTTYVPGTMGTDGNAWILFSVDLNIPKQKFKIGETLRVTIELWGRRTSTSAFQCILAADPKGRVINATLEERYDVGTVADIDVTSGSAWFSTIATAQIPFKTDV